MPKNILGNLMNGKINIIYGAGTEGSLLLEDFISLGIYIDGFCDADIKKQEICVLNKKVISPDQLAKIKGQCNVIISPKDNLVIEEIIDMLKRIGIDNYLLKRDIKKSIKPFYFDRRSIYEIILESKKKKIVVYGTNIQAEEIAYILNFIDVNVEYFVDDIEDVLQWNEKEVRPVYDLVYEENVLVLVTDKKREKEQILEQLGLEWESGYKRYFEYSYVKQKVTYILDPNLGYESLYRQNVGFDRFGQGDEELTIVTLGGSTTDARLFPFLSWSEILYNMLCEAGISAQILCGGCGGYKSSQELIKLIRDVLPMKPDIVIEYGGGNDISFIDEEEKYPFIHPYQMTLAEKAGALIEITNKFKRSNKIHLGHVSGNTPAQQYMDNIKTMNAICETHGIHFHGFLQPCLGSKADYSLDEMELIINEFPGWKAEKEKRFYDSIDTKGLSYITDCRYLFDNMEKIYIDGIHVTESGNKIIAQKIFDYVTSSKIL